MYIRTFGAIYRTSSTTLPPMARSQLPKGIRGGTDPWFSPGKGQRRRLSKKSQILSGETKFARVSQGKFHLDYFFTVRLSELCKS